DLFAFNDVNDNSVTGQIFGVGNGVTTTFQLIRSLYSFGEPVYLLQGFPSTFPSIYVNGTQTFSWGLSSTGLVTFTAPPVLGATLTWTGSYYWPCRFDEDEATFSNFYQNLWRLKSLKFSTEKLTN